MNNFPNDKNNIEDLVIRVDRELFERGVAIERRYNATIMESMRRLGFMISHPFQSVKTKEQIQIEDAIKRLYRPRDLAIGGHIGIVMYRDIFARISPPHIIGKAIIRPLDWIELTELQKTTIRNEPDNLRMCVEQFCCAMDIQNFHGSIPDKYKSTEKAKSLIELSVFQIHASAAVLSGGFDFRGAVQSSILAMELALKAVPAAHGESDEDLRKKYGHHLDKILESAKQYEPDIDYSLISNLIKSTPYIVDNRYNKDQLNRIETGNLAMKAQSLVATMVRFLSGRSCLDEVARGK